MVFCYGRPCGLTQTLSCKTAVTVKMNRYCDQSHRRAPVSGGNQPTAQWLPKAYAAPSEADSVSEHSTPGVPLGSPLPHHS